MRPLLQKGRILDSDDEEASNSRLTRSSTGGRGVAGIMN